MKHRRHSRFGKLSAEAIASAWNTDIIFPEDLEGSIAAFLRGLRPDRIYWLDADSWNRMSLIVRAREAGIRIATKKHPKLSAFGLKVLFSEKERKEVR